MARSDMFLKATGQRTGEILGESNDKVFANQIEILDWNWGMSAPTAVGGQRTGRLHMRELKFTKLADRASTALMSVLANNELINVATLSVRKAGGAAPLPYFIVKLEKARIVTYDVRSSVGEGGAPVLVEDITLAFKTVTVDYALQGGAGGSIGGMSFSGDTGQN